MADNIFKGAVEGAKELLKRKPNIKFSSPVVRGFKSLFKKKGARKTSDGVMIKSQAATITPLMKKNMLKQARAAGFTAAELKEMGL